MRKGNAHSYPLFFVHRISNGFFVYSNTKLLWQATISKGPPKLLQVGIYDYQLAAVTICNLYIRERFAKHYYSPEIQYDSVNTSPF